MEAEIATAASSNGTLSAVGNSLMGVGSAAKALVVTHPISMAAAGGALLGILAYRSLSKRRAKKKEAVAEEVSSAVAA
jgi:hypothetical protein